MEKSTLKIKKAGNLEWLKREEALRKKESKRYLALSVWAPPRFCECLSIRPVLKAGEIT